VPVTSDPTLWAEAVDLGNRVVWFHTFGAVGVGPSGDESGFGEFVRAIGVKVVEEIPDIANHLPEEMNFNYDSETLLVGAGRIRPVGRRIWEYDVGGMRVLKHWFNYRCANQRHRRRSSVLDDEVLQRWTPDLTDELLEILAVLQGCVALEDRQASLLNRICSRPTLSVTDFEVAGVLPPVSPNRLRVVLGDDVAPTLF
jgi:hypothetical protein